jgi:hypothetical protein
LKRKIGLFEPDKGFFALHSRSYGVRKRQDRALRNSPVDCFSEWARRRMDKKKTILQPIGKSLNEFRNKNKIIYH